MALPRSFPNVFTTPRKTAVRAVTKLLGPDRPPVTPIELLRAWSHGFGGWSYKSYDLGEHGNYDHYLPDSAATRLIDVNSRGVQRLMRDKLRFALALGEHLPIPEVLAVIHGGVVVATDGESAGDPVSEIRRLCDARGGIIVKPIDGLKGKGVLRIERSGDAFRVDGERVGPDALRERVARLDDVFACELLRPAGYSRTIFAGALNTVRVITMVDPEDGEPFIAAAVHRFGVAASAPTDNAARGALVAGVDVETGTLRRLSTLVDGTRTWFDVHPESGAPVEGVDISAWEEIRELLTGAVRRAPALKYVGWDVALTERGVRIIEGNHKPSLHTQRHNPYLRDPRILRFLEHHGVVRRRA